MTIWNENSSRKTRIDNKYLREMKFKVLRESESYSVCGEIDVALETLDDYLREKYGCRCAVFINPALWETQWDGPYIIIMDMDKKYLDEASEPTHHS